MARRSAGLVAAGLVVVAAGAAGCGAIGDLVDLEARIERRGYDVTETFHDDFGSDRNEVTIEAEREPGGEPPPEGQREIAEVVWRTYPRRFDTLEVELDGDVTTFTRGQLREAFGPRDPALDERSFDDDVRSGLRVGLYAATVLIVLGVTAIVITLVVLRRRARQTPPWPGAPGPGTGPVAGPGWAPPPPPPGPPPGWTPPPPP